MYFYNGAGVAAGDFNNDGLIDLFFASSQQENKLFLNTGELHFKDVTKQAKIPNDGGWSTGVSVVDINNDGLLDIYICRVGNYEVLKSNNQFLICKGIGKDGIPYYQDSAKAYGLDFSGFSTQAAFFDYDMDGDLDMYLLNHSIHQNGTFGPRQTLIKKTNPLSGDRIYRNDNGKFTDATVQTGINSSVIGYGLGIAVSDINLDGYPDIYIGNDFHENDYLYINQRNGTFKEELNTLTMHTSMYSMGVDIADVNNDAFPEVITMDMLPRDPYILKRSEGDDQYDIYYYKIQNGYGFQYTKNNLQLNRRNGMFSETGLYSGISATDWSWAALWFDFDNDGLKDLFISNGIPKRLNDIDYINYISSNEMQDKIKANNLDKKDMALIDKFPQIKIPDQFFKNSGNMIFNDADKKISGIQPTYSNGAVYADFDNDGDLDIVTNNIDDPAVLYENKSAVKKDYSFIEVKLQGDTSNINAIGAKVIVFAADSTIRTYEKFPVHGFLSSMETPLHIGLGNTKVDSMLLVWPDNTYEHINWQKDTGSITKMAYKAGFPAFDYSVVTKKIKTGLKPVVDVTNQVNLLYRHEENPFVEFDREPLIPHMVSREGPAVATGDMNGDGREDVFFGAAKRLKPAVFMQTVSGQFQKSSQPDLDKDSLYEDVDAAWADVNNDGFTDLIVASGGNEYYGRDINMQPRVYLNNANGLLTRLPNAFDNIFLTAASVSPYDFNGDGYIDLFIGSRAVPFNYGAMPRSYLLQNDGTGKFKDVTAQYSKDLQKPGFVSNSLWYDIDRDGDKDLLLALEWDGICAFVNHGGQFVKQYLTDKKGWWNFVLPYDIDNDGDVDLIAGNLGLNNRFKVSPEKPLRMYYNDFDNNGIKEQVLTYYLNDREIPFANKDELQKRMPGLKKKFLYAEDFAKATLYDIFPEEKLKAASVFSADYFSNTVFINHGNLKFSAVPMPWQAQLSPFRDAAIVNANGDSLPDVFLVGNFYENNIQMGRYDADFGTILVNKGGGRFDAESLNGLVIKGQSRHIRTIDIAGKQSFIIARNNDSAMVIQLHDKGKK
ncbi:VCBS repeat-containing protein [Foetidibacter luteolus]|uniref:VCBS repeat-containing protein n=1 Tax=Foetidibacter luteolus TaxID=2608880 RepID=UPI001F3204C2|nr:VCBS repeat-containing protein [Foetidibacter luteolus]